jgi:MEMO1 family protein
MLTYAAILPHAPFLIPGMKHEQATSYIPLREALVEVGEDLQSLHIDTMVLITMHGERYEKAISLKLHDPYKATMRSFGMMEHDQIFPVNTSLIDSLQRSLRRSNFDVTLTTNDTIDDASSSLLLSLSEYLAGTKIAIMSPPAGIFASSEIGPLIRDVLENRDERVAICSVSHLSERLNSSSPEGFHKDAEAFDKRIRQALVDQNRSTFKSIAKEMQHDVGAHELDAIRLLLGVLGDTRIPFKEHAYIESHGIGHLVMSAKL